MKYIASASLPLLEVLSLLSPQSSKTTLRSWIKEGRVQVDHFSVKTPHLTVQPGQMVTVGPRKKFLPAGIEIIYEDQDMVVVNKPAGLLSVSTAFEKGETVHTILKHYYHPRKIFVIHRLDQDTSGVMLFAFTERAFDQLKKIFEIHDIQRSYTAIVERKIYPPSGTWSSYLYEDEQYVVRPTDNPSGAKQAVTHYKVVDSNKRYTWLNLTLETGRKNQIRVHCQQAGCPVVGDKKYGGHGSPIKRLCLHAHLLSFTHPFTHKVVRFESPIPQEFYRLIRPSLKQEDPL